MIFWRWTAPPSIGGATRRGAAAAKHHGGRSRAACAFAAHCAAWARMPYPCAFGIAGAYACGRRLRAAAHFLVSSCYVLVSAPAPAAPRASARRAGGAHGGVRSRARTDTSKGRTDPARKEKIGRIAPPRTEMSILFGRRCWCADGGRDGHELHTTRTVLGRVFDVNVRTQLARDRAAAACCQLAHRLASSDDV